MNLIIDTDFALDDWMAIAYLAMTPGVNLVGVTVTGVGASYLHPGTRNALDFLATIGRADVPVAAGTSAALRYSNVYPISFRRQVNKAYGVALTRNPNAPSALSAVDFLATAIEANPGIAILSIGGGTNLGTLLKRQPGLASSIGPVFVMGGVINRPPQGTQRVAGNVHSFNADYSNKVAEWNMFVDPKGAKYLFGAGLDATLVPLNACNDVPLDLAFYDALKRYVDAGGATAAATAIFAALKTQRASVEKGQYFFWDPLAAVLLTEPSLAQYVTAPLRVRQKLDLERDRSAQTLIAASGTPAKIALSVPDAQAVRARFFETITDGATLPPD